MLRSTLHHPFAPNTCFLCAEPLTTANWSEEHVIPKWVQKQFNIEHSRLTLLNQTDIPYRQLKVPCCKKCNNEELARRERIVQNAISKGFEATKALPRLLLMQWVGKILLGLLYKELQLPSDRKRPKDERIIPVDVIKEYSLLFCWLQKALHLTGKHYFCPASVFVFRTQKPPVKSDQFDMFDNVPSKAFAIRLGKIGIVADFLENGFHHKNFAPQWRRYRKIELHPEQFRELGARIFYLASLIRLKTHAQFVEFDDGSIRLTMDWKPDGQEAVAKWDQTTYARVLASCWHTTVEKIFVPPASVWTLLHRPDGRLNKMPLKSHPLGDAWFQTELVK